MSLAQALAAQVPKKGPDCTVAILLATLPPEDVETLREALAAPQSVWSHTAISDALGDPDRMGKYAVKVASGTISRHRKGRCACGPR